MRTDKARKIALCGVMAAAAIVIMCFVGLIPFATYICPVLCTILCNLIVHSCGVRYGWTWTVAVSFLSLLLSPDKEAAAVFCVLGSYACLKRLFDSWRCSILWKIIYFNLSILLVYTILIQILGLAHVAQDFAGIGLVGLAVVLLLGNITFIILDMLLSRVHVKRRE